jgi:cell wall assembly regulator SMI1
MEELWHRLIELMRPHAPDVENWLNVGATEQQLRAAEEAMGVQLPDEVKEFYRIHNGQSRGSHDFWQGGELLSLERVVEEWKIWKGLLDGGDFDDAKGVPEGPIKADWWNPSWIPLTSNGGGDHHCLDLDPAEGGNVGQVIDFWHDWESRTLAAPSFMAWFEAFVVSCETGELVWSAEEEAFVEPDEL